jgi:hypothetical protein
MGVRVISFNEARTLRSWNWRPMPESPFPNLKPVETVAIREHLDVSFACVAIARESEQNSHGGFSVQVAQVGACCRFPEELLHAPNSRSISSWGMPGPGCERAASMRYSISASMGASSCARRNSK